MSYKRDKLIWKLFVLKKRLLHIYGCFTGKILPYNQELVDNLRDMYYGGIPLSVMLLSIDYCQGKCATCAKFITFGFGTDDFRVVSADVDSIRLNPYEKRKYGHVSGYAIHVFAERILDDGSVFVYDTTDGLVYDRNLYYRMESPRNVVVRNKEELGGEPEYLDVLNTSFDRAKNDAAFTLSSFENYCQNPSNLYARTLKAEINKWKKLIGYDELNTELDADKRIRMSNCKG